MRKHFFQLLLLLLASQLLASPALATDLRCQGDLMTPGVIITKVRQKCGTPLWEDRIGEVKRTSRDGAERLLYITQLTYEAGGGYFVLTFEGGELVGTEFFQK
jgi:hypothetical protein